MPKVGVSSRTITSGNISVSSNNSSVSASASSGSVSGNADVRPETEIEHIYTRSEIEATPADVKSNVTKRDIETINNAAWHWAQVSKGWAELAEEYASKVITGMFWIQIDQDEWAQGDSVYTYTILKPIGVAGVFKGVWESKELLENIDVKVTSTATVITSVNTFNGYILGTTAIPIDEHDIPVLDGDKSYIHEQSITSDTWTIVHNLDKNPSITVVDSANNVVEGEKEYIDRNTVIVKFNGAFKGKAYLN